MDAEKSSSWHEWAMRVTAFSALAVLGYLVLSLAGGAPFAPAPAGPARNDGPGEAAPRRAVPKLPQPGPGALSLSGQVLDVAGDPVAQVSVTAELELGPGVRGKPVADAGAGGLELSPVVVAISGAEGGFELLGLAPGRHRLEVEGDGIVDSVVRFVEVPGDSMRIVVSREVAVRGRVMEAGEPAAGVAVRLADDRYGSAREATTDEDGRFEFTALGEGVFRAWAFGGERAAPARQIERLGAGPFEPVELTMEPAAIVEGQVRDADTGRGVPAVVTLTSNDPVRPPRRGRSDSLGKFRLEGMLPGRYSARAFAPGYVPAEAVSFDAGGGFSPTLELARGGAVAGRVVTAEGRPVPGATVSVKGKDRDERARTYDELGLLAELGSGRAASDPDDLDGRFVPRGELGVVVGPIPFPPPAGAQSLRVATPLEEGGGFEAVEDLPVHPSLASSYVTDDGGRFRVTGILPGTYRVHASHPDYASGESAPLSVALGREKEDAEVVLVAGLYVFGRVTDRGGDPVVGASVMPAAAEGAPEVAGESFAVTGPDGRYRLGPLAGDAHLVASAGGYGRAERSVSAGALSGRAIEREVDFVLQAADAVLGGRVHDANDFPLRGARVELGGGRFPRMAVTDDGGRFSFTRLSAGTYQLRVEHPDYPELKSTARTGEQVELSVPFGGGIEAQVRDAHTLGALEGARVFARGPGGARQEATSGAGGAADLMALAPGRWRLEVSAPGYVDLRRELEVPAADRPGAVTVRDVVLELRRGATVGGVVRDEDGERVRGAKIAVGSVQGVTDEHGQFRLEDVPTGEVELRASRRGAAGSLELSLDSGDEQVTLEVTIEE